jgi:hypothetical protein
MMYFNNTGGGADAVASGASKANPYIEAGKIIGELTVGAVDASKRRAMDYSLSQQRLANELGLAKTAQEQQFNLGKLNILAQAQAGSSGSSSKADNSKLYLAIGVGGFVVLGTLMYVIFNK